LESCALLGESVQVQNLALRINTDKLELVPENLRLRHLDRSEAKFGFLAMPRSHISIFCTLISLLSNSKLLRSSASAKLCS
jgi:hypothetical protein